MIDAQHIAIATIERVDVLVSRNFKHIVNLDKIHLYNGVNLKKGYPLLEIRSPMEVLHEEIRLCEDDARYKEQNGRKVFKKSSIGNKRAYRD